MCVGKRVYLCDLCVHVCVPPLFDPPKTHTSPSYPKNHKTARKVKVTSQVFSVCLFVCLPICLSVCLSICCPQRGRVVLPFCHVRFWHRFQFLDMRTCHILDAKWLLPPMHPLGVLQFSLSLSLSHSLCLCFFRCSLPAERLVLVSYVNMCVREIRNCRLNEPGKQNIPTGAKARARARATAFGQSQNHNQSPSRSIERRRPCCLTTSSGQGFLLTFTFHMSACPLQ